MTENYAYHCKKGVTYHVVITRKNNEIIYSVDGEEYLKAKDENPIKEGIMGIRTFRTDLWCDNIKVTGIK